MTEYLDVEDLLAVVERSGLGPIRDVGLLDAAAHRPAVTVLGEDAYPDLATKAAAVLESVTRNHPLVDGNKRLGWIATVVLCRLNGHDLVPADEDSAYDHVIAVATGACPIEQSARVLGSWLRPLSSP